MIVYWLVVLLGSGVPVHVGTFSSMAACQSAVPQSKYWVPNTPGPPNPEWRSAAVPFVCVQANDATTNPPTE